MTGGCQLLLNAVATDGEVVSLSRYSPLETSKSLSFQMLVLVHHYQLLQ